MPLIVVIVLVGVVALVNLIRKQTIKPENLPYRKKDYLLTSAERSFYEVLQRVAGDGMQLFAKVRLVDLVWLPKGTQNRQAHLNRVLSKHVDFVLCNRQTVSPILVVELDDSSHNMDHRQGRDAVVNDFAAALPEKNEERDTDHGLKAGKKHAPGTDESDVRGDIIAVGLVEALDFR